MVQLLEQSVLTVKGAEDRIDGAVVRNIVAKIQHRREKTASTTRRQLRAIEDNRCGLSIPSDLPCHRCCCPGTRSERSHKHRTSPQSDVLGGLLKVVSPVEILPALFTAGSQSS
jgi:hypothetical protein